MNQIRMELERLVVDETITADFRAAITAALAAGTPEALAALGNLSANRIGSIQGEAELLGQLGEQRAGVEELLEPDRATARRAVNGIQPELGALDLDLGDGESCAAALDAVGGHDAVTLGNNEMPVNAGGAR